MTSVGTRVTSARRIVTLSTGYQAGGSAGARAIGLGLSHTVTRYVGPRAHGVAGGHTPVPGRRRRPRRGPGPTTRIWHDLHLVFPRGGGISFSIFRFRFSGRTVTRIHSPLASHTAPPPTPDFGLYGDWVSGPVPRDPTAHRASGRVTKPGRGPIHTAADRTRARGPARANGTAPMVHVPHRVRARHPDIKRQHACESCCRECTCIQSTGRVDRPSRPTKAPPMGPRGTGASCAHASFTLETCHPSPCRHSPHRVPGG